MAMGISAFFVFAITLCFTCDKAVSNGCDYDALITSLTDSRENLHELSKAFYPPANNNPEFVTVHYNFTDVQDSEETWYWSALTSHFLHPYEVFQYLSLFFAKPRQFYVGEVEINFIGTDPLVIGCADDNSVMQLVTQRLKLFAKQQKKGITFDDSYVAKAYNNEELQQLFENHPQNITAITICTVIFTIILTVGITIGVIFFYVCSKSANEGDWHEKVLERKQATFYAMASVSPFVNIYILALTCCAIGFWRTLSDELQDLHDTNNTLGPLIVLCITDLVCTLTNLSSLLAYIVVNCCDYYDEKKRIYILTLTILCSLVSIVGHAPFIAIAYLNDGYHASSIFIYYSVILFIAYGITWSGFRSCLDVDKAEATRLWCQWEHWPKGIIALLLVTLITFMGLVIIVTCYFVIIPINKTTSDAPNRLIGIFQSGGFAFGAFIVYKLLSVFNKESKTSTKE